MVGITRRKVIPSMLVHGIIFKNMADGGVFFFETLQIPREIEKPVEAGDGRS